MKTVNDYGCSLQSRYILKYNSILSNGIHYFKRQKNGQIKQRTWPLTIQFNTTNPACEYMLTAWIELIW